MFQSLKNGWRLGFERFGRREWLRRCSLLGLPALLSGRLMAAPTDAAKLRLGKGLYESIGVRPLINGRGTYTILSGSLMLPEVRAAMDEAAQHHVHLDELAEAIGARLAALTGAEWGLVSSGCSAALTHATAACVAGGNPDLHVRIPNLQGFAKDQAIIPRHSRNVYDAAVRAVGVQIVEVDTVEELEAALGPKTALIYILAGPQADRSPLNTKVICEHAKRKGVPVLVDAAAEILTVPNVHLSAGADLVGYSGGKCIRGPQSAGLLLGARTWFARRGSTAHRITGLRGMKVGKEEAMGMLMAVEMWTRRDHQAEWNRWRQWLDHIAGRVSAINGVATSVAEPRGLSNRTPMLAVRWDRTRLGISGKAAAQALFDGDPRIATEGEISGRNGSETGIRINPYMMSPGDAEIVADRLHGILSAAPAATPAVETKAPAVDITGQWDVQIKFAAGESRHTLHLQQRGNRLEGSHQGDFISRNLSGIVEGDAVRIVSHYSESHGDALTYEFSGRVSGDEITGTLDMGEYLKGQWTARKHQDRRG